MPHLFFFVRIEIERKENGDMINGGKNIKVLIIICFFLHLPSLPLFTEIQYSRNIISFCVRKISKETELILDAYKYLSG